MSVHLITGYKGTEHIQSKDARSFNSAMFGAGEFVMEIGNQLEGSILNNNTVRILDGDILMQGGHIRIETNTYEDLTVATGTAGKNRNDLIVMTYEKNSSDGTEDAYLEVLKGTETDGVATDPEYTTGTIAEGALKNQMPLYRVKVVGVVLSEIETLFTTIPTYKTLAEKYASQFKEECETYLGTLDILDSQEEIEANTQEKQVTGALAAKAILENLGGVKLSFDGKNFYAKSGNTSKKLGSADGTASASQVLSGATFYSSASDEQQTGTMSNIGAVTSNLNAGASYTIPAGYHNGKGKVTANGLASQTGATASADQIVSSNTAWVNGSKIVGTLRDYGSEPQAGRIGEYNGGLYLYVPDIATNEYGKGVVTRSMYTALSNLGNAADWTVLSGYSYTSSAGLKRGGAMPHNGAVNKTIYAGDTYTIPKGYHNGGGKVTAVGIRSVDVTAVNDDSYGRGHYVSGDGVLTFNTGLTTVLGISNLSITHGSNVSGTYIRSISISGETIYINVTGGGYTTATLTAIGY